MIDKAPQKRKTFKTANYIKVSSVFVVLSVLSAGINYLYYPLIAHFLGVEQFGAAQALIAIILQISAVFSGLNLVTIYLVRSSSPEKVRAIIETLQRLTVSVVTIGAILVAIFHEPILRFLHITNSGYLLLVSLNLLSSIPFIVAFGYLQARKHFVSAGFLQLTIVLVKLVLGAFLAKAFGVVGALLAIAIGQILGMILFWLICSIASIPLWEHSILNSLTPPSLKNLSLILPQLRNIISIFTVNVILVLFISFDIIVARHYFTPSVSGLYAGASTISNAVAFVCLPLISVLLPNLNLKSLRRSTQAITRTTLLVSSVLVVALAAFVIAPHLILGVFGTVYKTNAYLLWRLGIMMSLVSLIMLVLQVGAFYSPSRTALIAILGFIGLVININHHHLSPAILVSTITRVFATILAVGLLQLMWIYTHEQNAPE